MKVARNWDLPNPRAPARCAGAVWPWRGRGEVSEASGLPLKGAVRLRLAAGGLTVAVALFRKIKG